MKIFYFEKEYSDSKLDLQAEDLWLKKQELKFPPYRGKAKGTGCLFTLLKRLTPIKSIQKYINHII